MEVFFRLLRFYKTFNIVSALVSGLSIATLTFNEFHPSSTARSHAAEGFLVSSASTGVLAVMLATMLLFRFEGHSSATRQDLALAWTPLIILDWSILAFVVGLLLWYAEKNEQWRGALMATQLAGLLAFILAIAVWMWNTMSRTGGLGTAEDQRVMREIHHDEDKASGGVD